MDRVHFRADEFDDIKRVGVRQNPDANEHRAFSGEAHFRVVIFCAKRDIRHVTQSHERVAVLSQHKIFEFIHGAEISVGSKVDLHQRTFGASDGGKKIILRERFTNFVGTDTKRREAIRLEPYTHRKSSSTEDVGALHARQCRKAGLHDAHEIICDLIGFENIRCEAQIS